MCVLYIPLFAPNTHPHTYILLYIHRIGSDRIMASLFEMSSGINYIGSSFRFVSSLHHQLTITTVRLSGWLASTFPSHI